MLKRLLKVNSNTKVWPKDFSRFEGRFLTSSITTQIGVFGGFFPLQLRKPIYRDNFSIGEIKMIIKREKGK